MSLQGFSSRRLQCFSRKLQAFGIGTTPTRTLLDITVSDDGILFICDYLNNKVLGYQTDGTKIHEWGTQGTSDGQLNFPSQIVWYNNEVYVIDSSSTSLYNYRMQVFSESGTWDRTLFTGQKLFDIYDGSIYCCDSFVLEYSPTFSKYDTDGNLLSSFSITDMDTEVFSINYQTGVLTAMTIIPQDPDDSLEYGVPIYEVIYKYDDDGSVIATINTTTLHSVSQRFNYYGENITSDNVYFFTMDGNTRISKHTLAGAYIDREDVAIAGKTWRGIVYYNSYLYLPTNYSDTTINSKVQVYRADTLAFDSEWTAT